MYTSVEQCFNKKETLTAQDKAVQSDNNIFTVFAAYGKLAENQQCANGIKCFGISVRILFVSCENKVFRVPKNHRHQYNVAKV